MIIYALDPNVKHLMETGALPYTKTWFATSPLVVKSGGFLPAKKDSCLALTS